MRDYLVHALFCLWVISGDVTGLPVSSMSTGVGQALDLQNSEKTEKER
jgi:hypothetical protein